MHTLFRLYKESQVQTLKDLDVFFFEDRARLLEPCRAIYKATPDKAVLTYRREGNTLQVYLKPPSWRAKLYWYWLRKKLPMFFAGLYWWCKAKEHAPGPDGKRAREPYDRSEILPEAKRVCKV